MQNLLGSHGDPAAPTLLPEDHPDAAARADLETGADPVSVAATYPAASYAWAELAGRSLAEASPAGDVAAYAYARTGYHRGLDALRRAGWRGTGPVPFAHRPNQGFLIALAHLADAAGRIGETDEAVRCSTFLDDCDPTARESIASIR